MAAIMHVGGIALDYALSTSFGFNDGHLYTISPTKTNTKALVGTTTKIDNHRRILIINDKCNNNNMNVHYE